MFYKSMKTRTFRSFILIFGSLLLLFLSSCSTRVDSPFIQQTIYRNHSSFDISIIVFTSDFQKSYTLKNSDSLTQIVDLDGGILLTDGIIFTADSVSIRYENERTTSFNLSDTSILNFIRLDNFDILRYEKYGATYRYTFTIDDYNYAGSK
jgi:hypothetical protein